MSWSIKMNTGVFSDVMEPNFLPPGLGAPERPDTESMTKHADLKRSFQNLKSQLAASKTCADFGEEQPFQPGVGSCLVVGATEGIGGPLDGLLKQGSTGRFSAWGLGSNKTHTSSWRRSPQPHHCHHTATFASTPQLPTDPPSRRHTASINHRCPTEQLRVLGCSLAAAAVL